MKRIRIDTVRILDWDSFHQIFREAMGFPDYYGANMDAWIDCMSYLDDPAAGMSTAAVTPREVILLEIPDAEPFKIRCPEQFSALVECTAIVNQRFVNSGCSPMLALVFL